MKVSHQEELEREIYLDCLFIQENNPERGSLSDISWEENLDKILIETITEQSVRL